MRWVAKFVAAAFLLGLLPLIQQDAYNWCWYLARWVMRRAVRCLPEALQDEREREWDADLYQLKDRGFSALLWAVGILVHAPGLAQIERGLPSIPYLTVKRAFDLLVASSGLILLAPVLVIIAVAIRLTSPGQVVFGQSRIGRDGRAFVYYKFRVMAIESTANHPSNPPHPRITRIGGLLVRSAMDELPQLWNVIRGDMSLVGPRPLPPHVAKDLTSEQQELLKATPGLVSSTDVNESPPRTLEDMIKRNLEYVRHRSFRRDLKAMLVSFVHLMNWLFKRG